MTITSFSRRRLGRLALCLSLFGLACAASSPGAALEKYMRTIDAGESGKAVAMFPKSMQSQYGSKLGMMVAEQIERTKKMGGVKAVDVVSEDVTGDIAAVTFATHYGNGKVDTSSTKMLREDNEWKINPQ